LPPLAARAQQGKSNHADDNSRSDWLLADEVPELPKRFPHVTRHLVGNTFLPKSRISGRITETFFELAFQVRTFPCQRVDVHVLLHWMISCATQDLTSGAKLISASA
jgi:hypothetical protein